MKVLLINPPTSNLYAQLGVNLPPLGLAYLAAVLRDAGHKAQIIDLCVDPGALNRVRSSAYDLVGISADTPRFPAASALAKEFKERKKIVVMGGYHVTFMDEEALNTGGVDYVVRGEGEEVFLNLVNTLEGGGDPKDGSGISYIEGRFIIRTENALPPLDLNQIPFPARDLLPLNRYKATLKGIPVTNLITSRGCPFNCNFCASSRFGGLKWRARTVSSIIDEIEELYFDYDYRAFAFMDDNFTLNPKRVLDFADELDNREFNISWWCFSRVDTMANNESLVKRMAESGARTVFLGLESSNEEVLLKYGKRINTNQIKQAISLLKKYGIDIYGSFIIGAFHETKNMIRQTIRFAKKLKLQTAQFSILTPYPGTALFEQLAGEKRLLHRHWEFYDGAHAVIETNNLKPKETQKLFAQAYFKFYLSIPYLFRFIKNSLQNKNPIRMALRAIDFTGRLVLQVLKTSRNEPKIIKS
jgi:anaerobic magnesium-protoporphyrin IX monomethyl ester cyclase